MKFLVRKAPEHFIRTVNDEINSLLNRHFDSYFPEAAYWEEQDKFSMPVEITDKGKDYEVRAELPGVKKEDLDIDIDKNYMTISAEKKEENVVDEKTFKKSEIRYGSYSRTVYFPEEINIDKTEAKLEHGILKITAPKKYDEKESRKKLAVH
ncbi:MAG: Hsp20/alpha crystallin family protein [Candidatus Gastranaerophilaceae bacterium]|nr:Hsp20/alpha crystallin family protein [Candidatus Gastranaerophilaceae bacterium]